MKVLEPPVRARWRFPLSKGLGTLGFRVATAVATVGLGTLVVKVIQGAQELAMAYRFGTGDALDAFFVAYAAATFLLGVLGGAFLNAFLPFFHRSRQSAESPERLASHLAFYAFVFLIGLAVLAAIGAPSLIKLLTAGFPPAKRALAVALFRRLLPLFLFGSLASFGSVVLNFQGRFVVAALSPVAVPLLGVIYLIAARPPNVGGLVRMLVVGSFLQLSWVLIEVRRRRLMPLPRPAAFEGSVRSALREYALVVVGLLIICTNPVVDQAMTAPLGAGSVAVLNYATRPIAFLIAVTAAGIGTGVMPYLSEAVAVGDWRLAEGIVKKGSFLILAITLPVVAALSLGGGRLLVQLLFVHGAFTEADAGKVAAVLAVYAWVLPVFLISLLVQRLLAALGANKFLAWTAAASFLVNIGLDYVLGGILGVRGIALGTTILYALLAPTHWLTMRHLLKKRRPHGDNIQIVAAVLAPARGLEENP